ncbi:hypothetical protein B0H17DRAFT_1130675 [Mycena rosella]|uniref:Uncharacterized protein n=1 Tax=Mycena rosella TaxID=1033263 RepID=A0AAD7GIV2_MYCRO|nr:hypothetical protein B0H17DRAFT_1130675 [Mycena rosella]
MIQLFKTAVKLMSEGERAAFCNAWLERLIAAAVESGGKIPPKRKAPIDAVPNMDRSDSPPAKRARPDSDIIIIDGDSDGVPSAITAATSVSAPAPTASTSSSTHSTHPSSTSHPKTVVGNPKQQSLNAFGWKPATTADVRKYWSGVVEAGAEVREVRAKADEKLAEEKK